MFTSLLVTLAVAFSLALVLLVVPALLVQRLLAGRADEQEDWVDLFPAATPIAFEVDGFGVRRVSA